VIVRAIEDNVSELDERIVLTLTAGAADGYRLGFWAEATITIHETPDLIDIDSDNTNGFDDPDRSLGEERIEDDMTKPGKYVLVNAMDDDADGIPDFADGFDWDGVPSDDDLTAGKRFVPVILILPEGGSASAAEVRITYGASDPKPFHATENTDGLRRTGSGTPQDPYVYTPQGGWRLWRRDGSEARNAATDFIETGVPYNWSSLPDGPDGTKKLWLEAVTVSPNSIIIASMDPDGPGPAAWLPFDSVLVTPLQLGLFFNTMRDSMQTTYRDVPTAARPYQFWLNNDHDVSGELDGADHPVDGSHPPDVSDNRINNARDLEDFSSFQLAHSLLSSRAIGGQYKLRFAFTDVTRGSPAIKVYKSMYDGLSYLYDPHKANVTISYGNGRYVGAVTATTPLDIPITLFRGLPRVQFLFEGQDAGTGALTVQLVKGTQVLAGAPAYLDLRPMTELYDHFTVGDTITMDWDQIPLAATQIQTAVPSPLSPAEPDYILFVHGWRMTTWDRRSFAETAYKRLWWQGYNGGFGLYSWPTEWNPGDFWSAVTDPANYDHSERKAYWSAWGLQNLLAGTLNDQYPGKVNVFGHSMGNIVISEALRLEATSAMPDRIVHTYVASQAASVAHAYDAAMPFVESWWSVNTPEVYANYPPTGQPYFAPIDGAANRLINFYNPNDFALGLPWMLNQDSKPDFGWTYDILAAQWQRGMTVLAFPNDRYEIFAHIAEARSLPLGRQPDVNGPFDSALQVNLDLEFEFGGGQRTSHSAQFQATNMDRWEYWWRLAVSLGVSLR